MLTFVDSCVLIAAARGQSDAYQRISALLVDMDREWASSWFVRLEVMPKPLYFKQKTEAEFYQTFFDMVTIWTPIDMELIIAAYDEATETGMSALDALHVVSAVRVQAAELVTMERPTRSIHRARNIKVVSLTSIRNINK